MTIGDAEPSKKSSLHPAFTVSNIRNHVRVVLDSDKVLYSSWSTLFTLHARAYKVMSFIDGSTRPNDMDDETWCQLDAIVLQWIYSTLSDDLVIRILEPRSTAHAAWTRLKNMFHDNKGSRAAQLEYKFIHTKLEDFTNIGDYCQQIKSIADQLEDIDNTVSQQRRVLQLVNGLTSDYDTVGTVIQQSSPLPDFFTARSMLLLEEQRRNSKQATATSQTVLNTQTQQSAPAIDSTSPPSNYYNRGGYSGRRGGGRSGRRGGGRGGGRSDGRGGGRSGGHGPPNTWSYAPPARAQAGILGPRPDVTHGYGQSFLAPTDITSGFDGLTLQPPDHTWYMDTGATSHLTNNAGYSDGNQYSEVQ